MREMRPDGSIPAHTSIFVPIFEIQLPTTGFHCYCVQYLLKDEYAAMFRSNVECSVSDVQKLRECPVLPLAYFLPVHVRFGSVWALHVNHIHN